MARSEVEGVIQGKRFVLLDPMRCNIAKELHWGKGERFAPHEKFALELFCKIAVQTDTVLDIGANTGLFAIATAMVNPKAKVHAYEIVPEVYVHLFRNLARNDLLGRVVPHCYGIGEEGGRARMPVDTSGSSSPSAFSSHMQFSNGVEIPFHSLNELIPSFRGSKTMLLKIDVESTEGDIFRHADRFLAEWHPDMLCEILPNAPDVEMIGRLLKDLGYQFYKIQNGKLVLQERLAADFDFHDWLFTTKKSGELASLGIPVQV